jgi:hypothetical protein
MRNGPSWEQKQELGVLNAIFLTIRDVLFKPSDTFANMKREGGIGNPLLYALIVGTPSVMLGVIFTQALNLIISGVAGGTDGFLAAMIQSIIAVVIWMFLSPILIAVGSFVGAGMNHLCLMIVGAANRDFETTYRTCCYCISVSVIGIIPFCGAIAVTIWQTVLLIIGLSKTHEITTGKAAIAVLIPFALCCVGVGILGSLGLLGFLAAYLPELQ